MNTLYYYFYLLYTKIITEDEPYATASFALSVCQSFIINGIINFSAIYFFCFWIDKWIMLSISALLILLNYIYYIRNGVGKKIVEAKPMFFSNYKTSIVISLLFFILSLSFIILLPIYEKSILDNCR